MSVKLTQRERELGARAVPQAPGDGRDLPGDSYRLPTPLEKRRAKRAGRGQEHAALRNAAIPKMFDAVGDRPPVGSGDLGNDEHEPRFTAAQLIARAGAEGAAMLDELGGAAVLADMADPDEALTLAEWRRRGRRTFAGAGHKFGPTQPFRL